MGTALVVFLFFAFIGGAMYMSTSIDNKANERAQIIYSQKKQELLSDVIAEKENIESELQDRIAAIDIRENDLAYQKEIQEKLFEEKTIGFPWVAEQYSLIKTATLEECEKYFRTKNHPALKTADAIRYAKLQVRASEKNILWRRVCSTTMSHYCLILQTY